MARLPEQSIPRDPALFYWVLFPITIVMILTGILRHYAAVLMNSSPKPPSAAVLREQRNLIHGSNVRQHANVLSPVSFEARRARIVKEFKEGKHLKDGPESREKPSVPGGAMADPANRDNMLNMMKGNMMMIIPQTLIMGWINAFFAGFVILKLPFPLTLRFKAMLQSGVATQDLDVRWVSSLSWYFLNLFGLQPIFTFLLGNDNAAVQMMGQQMAIAGGAPGAGMIQPGQDVDKMFLAEAEQLEVLGHQWILDGVVERMLDRYEKVGGS